MLSECTKIDIETHEIFLGGGCPRPLDDYELNPLVTTTVHHALSPPTTTKHLPTPLSMHALRRRGIVSWK